jgi:hypothetical protein
MIRHNRRLDSWTREVAAAFPCLSRPQATVLALYSFGAMLADRSGLTSVAMMLVRVLGVGYLTIRSRLQEFYQPASAKSGRRRRELNVAVCFGPLIRWVLKGWQSDQLALALDATALADRFTVLSISVVYRGTACPVAWKIMPANVRHAWKPEWIALLRLVHPFVPAGWNVIVMSDRGLYARWLYQEIVALDWHPLMRITRVGRFRKSGSRSDASVTALVRRPGQRWKGRGTAFPKKRRTRLDCTLFACWESGYKEPWFIVSDLDPDQGEGLWYAMRSWTEHGYKMFKSQGWHWDKSRMTDPARASRLWLVLAVATRYVLGVGGKADASDTDELEQPLPPFVSGTKRVGEPIATRRNRASRSINRRAAPPKASRRRASGTKQRVLSVFRKGIGVVLAALIAGHALPKPAWKPEPWLEIGANYRTHLDQPPSPIPKNPSP